MRHRAFQQTADPSATPDACYALRVESAGFKALIDQRIQATDPQARAEIDAQIRRRYERDAAVLISDMSGFSRITQEEGILHFVELIHRMQDLALPILEACEGGRLVKAEADNLYASFDTVQAAVDTAVRLQDTFARAFAGKRLNDTVSLSIGIAWGRLLDVDGQDYYGDPVNLASKLGEDLASGGDVFLTRAAAQHMHVPGGWTVTPRQARISEVDIDFVALSRT